MSKLKKVLLFYVVLPLVAFPIIWYGLLAYPLPWKELDPLKQEFQIEDFRLTDYSDKIILMKALYQIFPVGTPKEKVDDILIKRGGAKSYRYHYKHPEMLNIIDYRYKVWNLRAVFRKIVLTLMISPNYGGWHVRVKYDKDLRVESIRVISP